MAESLISEVISVIVEKLGSKAFKEIMYAKDLDSHIKRLQQLKTTIEATLLDARSSLESCTYARKDVLEKLDYALTDLDDYLDAKAARAKQKKIMEGNKFIKEVRVFFSKSNQLVSPFRDAHKLRAIIDQFQSISRDQVMVRDIISLPSVNKTQIASSTGSLWANCHILTELVIGRDTDRDEIVSRLLHDSQTLSVVSIVGIGGIGKTTLAKYVYNDERVKSWFDVRLWVSTTQVFDVQKVLFKILATLEDQMTANCDIVQMYDLFQQAIGGKKLLLVLDNVWDQESLWQKWQDLKSVLVLGGNGSKVLLTTRNKKVARIMDCVNPYVLGDLTGEDSWLLFQKFALTHCRDPNLEAIGREIVDMCPNVPLVIRSIGGLLATKCSVMEWLAFRNDQLANFSAYGRDIMQTLKLSYDQLDERLKLCVSYCSLFPKGYQYYKDEMIRLWISLGYIETSYERERLEDAAEECMLMLTIQGFFTVYRHENYLEMHNLMHDLVVSIADFKYKMAEADECEIDERVRHLSVFQKESEMEPCTKVFSSFFKLKQLQSLLVMYSPFDWSSNYVANKITYVFPRLRILCLSNLGIENVPSSLSELVSLRYLDLSDNPITHLPKSITKLVELLSLDVSCCSDLDEFPKGIRKLVKLRHFRNDDCPALIPKGVESLTDLQTLDEFRLEFSESFPRETDCGLAELNIIINRLTNKVTINVIGDAFSRSFNKTNQEHWESKGNLVQLKLNFEYGSTKGDEMVIKALHPNTNMRELVIQGYKGETLPRWMKDEIHYFQNLVEVRLWNLEGCKSLGSFGGLLHLLVLECHFSNKIEYIEENWCGGTSPYGPLFPSLEQLRLKGMPKLKKWYKVPSSSSNILLQPNLAFPKLQKLWVDKMEFVSSMTREFRGGFSSLETLLIYNSGDLRAIPDDILNLSNLQKMSLHNCNGELKERCQNPIGEDWPIIKHIPCVNLY